MKLKVKPSDGPVYEVEYKPTSPDIQGQAVSQYLIASRGWRPSEAAMKVAGMSPRALRSLYQNLIIMKEIKQ